MKHLNKSSASAIAIEIISIIIAVVLGFIVNEWREVIHNKGTGLGLATVYSITKYLLHFCVKTNRACRVKTVIQGET